MTDILVTTTSSELADAVLTTHLEEVELSLLLRKAWDPQSAERIFHISVTVASEIGKGVFTCWLYDAFKTYRAGNIEIEGQRCPVTEAEIATMIEKIVRDAENGQPGIEQE
jgi:hypothetical protein